MQGPFKSVDFKRDRTPRVWFFERVWNFGANIAAALLALVIALPILYVIFQYWKMIFAKF